MSINSIKNDNDLKATFIRLRSIFQAEQGTPEANEMEMLVTLISAYEDKYYSIGQANRVEAIHLLMEQKNNKSKVIESHHDFQGNNADLDILMDLLENPHPANDAIKNLMGLLDGN